MTDLPAVPMLDFDCAGSGGGHCCGITTANTVECWGSDSYRVIADAPLGNNYVEVSLSSNFACALDASGIAICWGNYFGRPTPPSTPLSTLSLSDYFGCGLDAYDNSVVCFGDDIPPIPTGTGYTALSVADEPVLCVIDALGELECTYDSLLSWADLEWVDELNESDHLFSKIDAGSAYGACAIDVDGVIHCWDGYLVQGLEDDRVFQPASGPSLGIDVVSGDELSCTVLPHDSFEQGGAVQSALFTVP